MISLEEKVKIGCPFQVWKWSTILEVGKKGKLLSCSWRLWSSLHAGDSFPLTTWHKRKSSVTGGGDWELHKSVWGPTILDVFFFLVAFLSALNISSTTVKVKIRESFRLKYMYKYVSLYIVVQWIKTLFTISKTDGLLF